MHSLRKETLVTIVGGLILLIAALHFACQYYFPDMVQLQTIFPKFFYLPIILAAFWWGLKGGIPAAAICAAIHLIDLYRKWDPSDPDHLHRILQIVLFFLVGGILGSLVDSERRYKKDKLKAEEMAEEEFYRAITDPLTRCYNRRHFNARFYEFWERAERHGELFSLMMIDLNDFKHINDRYGHVLGDLVLQTTVRTLLNNIRKTDFIFRYGGDEFLLLLPSTKGDFAMNLAKRLRDEISKLSFKAPDRKSFKVDFSIGIIEYHRGFKDQQEMFRRLDEALYKAKKEDQRVALAS